MNDFEPIDVRFLINNDEFKADANAVKADITGVDATAAKSAQKVSQSVKLAYDNSVKEVGEYTAAVNQSSAAMAAQTKTIRHQKPKWDGLGNSINQISREMPAFAVSAQTGILALSNNIPILADEIARLKVKNDALVASGQKGVPVWKQVLKSTFGWGTALSLAVTLLTIYGREVGVFFKKLFKGKGAIDAVKASQEALNKAFESTDYKNAVKELLEVKSNIDLAKKGMLDATTVVDEYNKSLGGVIGQAKDLNEVEQLLIDNSDKYIQSTLYKAAANIALDEAAQEALEHVREQLKLEEEKEKLDARVAQHRKNGNTIKVNSKTGNLTSYARDIVRQSELDKELAKFKEKGEKQIASRNKIYKALREKAASFGLGDFLGTNKDTKGGQSLINQRQRLLDRIAAIDAEYARKSYTKDEAEIQALKDKFAKIRVLVERFNADPKNKSAAISIEGLNATESKALGDLTYRQDTTKLSKEIREQKALFDEFEAYKSQFGEKYAKQRFKNELKAFKSFGAFLKAQVKENEAAQTAVDNGTATGGQTERIQLLKNAADLEIGVNQDKLDALLAQLKTFEDQKRLIEEQYQSGRKIIEKQYSGTDQAEKLAQLARLKDAELEKVNDAAFKTSQVYEDMNERVLNMTRRQIIDQINLLQSALSNGMFTAADGTVAVLSKAQVEALEAVLAELGVLLEETDGLAGKAEKVAQGLDMVAGSLFDLANGIGSLNPELAETLATMGELASVGADAASAVASFAMFSATSNPLDLIDGITKTISAVGKLFSMRRRAQEKRRKVQQEILDFQDKIEAGERRINALANERNIADAKGLELTLERLQATKEALALAATDNQSAQDGLLADLQDENYIENKRSLSGMYSGIVLPVYASLAGKSAEEILDLLEKEQLEGKAKELAEELKRMMEAGEDISAQLDALKKETEELFTGTTASALTNGIVEGLRNGYQAVEDFAADMERVLKEALLRAVSMNVIDPAMQEWIALLKQYMEDGVLTEDEKADLKEKHDKLTQDAIDYWEAINGVIDEDLIADTGERGLQGAIRREMTEQTASELTGLFRAQYDITKRNFLLDETRFDLEKQHNDLTMRIMQSNAAIETNTANTVVELQFAVAELKIINGNTKQNSGSYDRGF